MERLSVISVNISDKKGTIKRPVNSIKLGQMGIEGDAHAGKWHRQVSLLGTESIEKMQQATGRKLHPGEFAENITTQGFPLYKMHPLDRLISDEIELEVTQIGKKCHGEKCAVFKETGNCVMPREGIFCRVVRGGRLKTNDVLEYRPKVLQVRIITLSDRVSSGEYEDKSGPLLGQLTEEYFSKTGRVTAIQYAVIPDEPASLKLLLESYTLEQSDIVFTTGGTGIGPRDITPDVIRPMLNKEIPGIMEMIRVKYGMQFPNALVSRSVAGIIGKTLVYALPGSPKAVGEYADEILKTIEHSLRMLHEIGSHE
jgi:molybdopterin adenylyltransferase